MQNVLDKSQQTYGVDDPDSLAFELNLAVVKLRNGQADRAVATIEKLLPIYREVYGPFSESTLTLMHRLAEAYGLDGQLQKAVEMSKLVYDQRLKTAGPLAGTTILNGFNYAQFLARTNERESAKREYEILLARARESLGDDHHQTIALMADLGEQYLSDADLEKGVPLIEEAWERKKSKYGENDKLSLTTANSLGMAYLGQGDYEKAAKQFKHVYDLSIKIRGADHPETLTVANNLASTLKLSNQFDAAIELFETTLDTQTKKLGRGHPDTVRSMINLASTMQSASRFSDSIPVCREAIELAEAIEKDHFYAQIAMSLEGVAFLELEDYQAAREVITQCHESRIRTAPEHWLRFRTMSLLGEAVMGLEDYEAAEPLLLEGYEKLVELESKIPAQAKFRVGEAKERLVRVYEAKNMPDKAAEYRD